MDRLIPFTFTFMYSFCSFTGERSLSEDSNIEMFFEIFPGLIIFIVQADVNGQNDWLTIIRLPTMAPYLADISAKERVLYFFDQPAYFGVV